MKMISKGIRSTRKPPTVIEHDEPEVEPEPHPNPITAPTDNIHDVYVYWFENPLYDDRNTVGVDLLGRYPDTSYDGHKYIYVMHDSITNYINAKGLTSRKAPELLRGFEECYNDLKRKGFIARLVKLDNECSKQMIQMFEDQQLDYQLVAPGDHQLNTAEHAIQTFKNHFIAVRSGMDSNFPKRAWHHSLYQIVITLNMLRPSRQSWHFSIYASTLKPQF